MNEPVAKILELAEAIRQGLDVFSRTVDSQRIEDVLTGRLVNGNPATKEKEGDALFAHAFPSDRRICLNGLLDPLHHTRQITGSHFRHACRNPVLPATLIQDKRSDGRVLLDGSFFLAKHIGKYPLTRLR